MPVFPQVVVAPGGAVAADDVDFAIRTAQLDQQIVQKIELLQVIVLHVAGAMVAEKMVQLRNLIRLILIADAVDHIDPFTSMKVIKAEPIRSRSGLGARVCRSAWQHQEQHQAEDDEMLLCHGALFQRATALLELPKSRSGFAPSEPVAFLRSKPS